jgi:CubicO group peptidase (beta-lactamase class C family)
VQFEYSNLGVGLLGNALSAITNQSYEELERERVWRPLGMTHTAITLTPWMKQHLALGHDAGGKVVANWDIPAFAGAGAIRSTTTDMLKFVAANLRGSGGALERAMAFAQQPRAPSGPNGHIGLNWLIIQPAKETIVCTTAATGGYRTFVGLVPAKHLGVVVLTNSGGVGADDIGRHLLDPAIPLAGGSPATRR